MEKVEKQRQSISQRVSAFLDKHYALVFAPIIVAFVYMFALMQQGVYPFGDKYTAASYDLSAQICPFVEHLFDVFDGKSTLTFSYAIVGGADVTGTFLYFFVSPFSFLFLIFGDGKVAHASSIVMLCKLMTISVAGAWFAKKLFKNIPDYICIAVGVAYAYCGYTFVANTYINWMDFLIYLPFCVGAFKRFVETGKFLLFSVFMACCIYTCFSIACFSMLTAFPALVAYGLLCVKKEEKMKFVAYLCLSFVVAVAISLPILFPAYNSYIVSGRKGVSFFESLFENLWKGFTVNSETGMPENFNSSTFNDSYTQSLYRKWSYILSDSVFVVLTCVWFVRKGLKDKFSQFMLIAGALTLLPLVVDESMNLLNMGSYMSYALRFGFLNAIYFMGGACLCIQDVCYKPFHSYDGEEIVSPVQELKEEPREETQESVLVKGDVAEAQNEGGTYPLKSILRKENTRPLLWIGGFLLLSILIVGFMLWFTSGDNYKDFLALFKITSNSFSGSYAHSLGGFEVIVVLFLGAAILTIAGAFFVSDKRLSPRLFSIVLIAVIGVQVFFYNQHLVVGNSSTQHETIGHYQVLNEELNRRDDSYFRVKDYNDKMTACVPFSGDANSFSVFSSVVDADNFVTFQLFGYKGNGKNSFKSSHNTDKKNRSDEFGDSFLGYKYFISTQSDLHKDSAKGKYVRPVYVLDEDGKEKLDADGNKIHLSQGNLYAYENEIVFPLGYRVPNTGFTFAVENTNNSTNRKKNQQALYKYLRGEDLKETTGSEYVTPQSARSLSEYLHSRAAEVEVSAGKITAKVTAGKSESLFLNFVAIKGYSVTVNGKSAKLIENDLKFLQVALEEGENEVVFSYSSPYPKQAFLGLVAAVILLAAIAVVVLKTKLVEKIAPVIAWAGILLAVGVVAFFMLYPTGAYASKIVELLKGLLLK